MNKLLALLLVGGLFFIGIANYSIEYKELMKQHEYEQTHRFDNVPINRPHFNAWEKNNYPKCVDARKNMNGWKNVLIVANNGGHIIVEYNKAVTIIKESPENTWWVIGKCK